jgi:hypothetical protein
MNADADLDGLDREALISEVKRLRAGIRAHRDCSGHDLCWHHPELWALLPERIDPAIAVPPWPKFIRGCLAYRESLDRELRAAPIADIEYDNWKGLPLGSDNIWVEDVQPVRLRSVGSIAHLPPIHKNQWRVRVYRAEIPR